MTPEQVHAKALKALRTSHNPHDLAQEVWIRYETHRITIRNPTAWINTVARNLLLNEARRDARPLPRPTRTTPGPLELLLERERTQGIKAQVGKILRHLPPRDHEVTMLRLQGHPWRRVAEILGTTENAIRLRWHRLAKRLRGTSLTRREDSL